MAQPMQQQLTRIKRNSTSPGEEVRHFPLVVYYASRLKTYWVVSTRHYPEMTSPRQSVSAHVGLRLRSSNSNSNSSSNSSSSNSNNRSNNNNTSSSINNSNSHSLNKHRSHSTNPNNLRWHLLARFHRPCLELGLYGGPWAGSLLTMDSASRRCIR